MDSIQDRRRQRLRQLIEERFGGSQANFAAHVERQSGYVARVLNGGRPFGEKFARSIEGSCGLPDGWMDADPGAMFTSTEHQQLMRRLRKLSPEKLKIVDDVIRAMLPSLEQDGSIADTILKKAPLPSERAAAFLPPAPSAFEE